MARINPQIISQRKNSVANAVHQLPVIPARKIRSSYGSGKQGVACKNSSRRVKRDAPRRMARRVDHGDRVMTELQPLCVMEVTVRTESQTRGIGRMNQHRCSGDAFEFSSASGVIHVAMGYENIPDLDGCP